MSAAQRCVALWMVMAAVVAMLTVSPVPARALACAQAPTLITAPVASLSPDQTTITTTDGVWDTHGCETEFAYTWYRQGFLIGDDGDHEYLVSARGDEGLNVYAEVTASNEYGSTSAFSNQLPIPPGKYPCTGSFVETAPPAISGEAEVTGTVTVTEGTWQTCHYAIAGFRYQWFRNGVALPGETERTYVPVGVDLGQSISATVSAVHGLGEEPASTASAVIIGPEPPPDVGPVLDPDEPAATGACFGAMFEDLCSGGGAAIPGNFGGKYVHHENPRDIRGVRAGIRTPRRKYFYLPSQSFGLMRIVAEAGASLMQTGFGYARNYGIAGCGIPPQTGRLYTYFESLDATTPGTYSRCGWLDETRKGRSNLYTVYRKLRVRPVDNTTTWQANINGRQKHARNLHFDAASFAAASGELRGSRGNPYSDGDVHGFFGKSATPLGTVNWQLTTTAGSRGWANIASATNLGADRGDGRWIVTPLPGPFSVDHRCDSQHRYGC